MPNNYQEHFDCIFSTIKELVNDIQDANRQDGERIRTIVAGINERTAMLEHFGVGLAETAKVINTVTNLNDDIFPFDEEEEFVDYQTASDIYYDDGNQGDNEDDDEEIPDNNGQLIVNRG